LDYQSIIDNLEVSAVIDLMTKLGADRWKDEGTHIVFPTICHNTDASEASMKLYFYKNTKLFNCYTEDGIMSIFKFMKVYYETRGIEYDWVSDIYNVILDCSNFHPGEGFDAPRYESLRNKYGRVKQEKELPEYNAGALDTFVKLYPPEWLSDGISTAAMDKFGIRYSISQNKIIIPHYDVSGRLVGIRGRALNEWEVENVGKYMPVRLEQTWYKHPLSMNLYGLYENQENIKKSGVCYVFESEKSVLQCESFSGPNCAVAVCGSQFNKYQLGLLLRTCHPSEVILCFDNEELEDDTKYFDKLWAICQKYKNYTNFSFVYDRLRLLKLKDSPSDRGEEIFRKLLQKRVKVK
jgi:hypothetical protein